MNGPKHSMLLDSWNIRNVTTRDPRHGETVVSARELEAALYAIQNVVNENAAVADSNAAILHELCSLYRWILTERPEAIEAWRAHKVRDRLTT